MPTITTNENAPLYLLVMMGGVMNCSRLVPYERLLDELCAMMYGDYLSDATPKMKTELEDNFMKVLRNPENWVMAEDSNGADVCMQFEMQAGDSTIMITRVMDYAPKQNEYISFHGEGINHVVSTRRPH